MPSQPKITSHFISPNFLCEKLENPSLDDIIDVFEDRITNWTINPAKQLLTIEHGEVAAVALSTNYFEGIEIYTSGMDSKGRSKIFFRRGFQKVFAAEPQAAHIYDTIADALYELLRCGFAHETLFKSGIYFSSIRKEALAISWPKKNESFDPEGKLESAVINPARFVQCIEIHFKNYIRQLRESADSELRARFLAAIEIKWRLDEPGHIIGMTEEEFLSGN